MRAAALCSCPGRQCRKGGHSGWPVALAMAEDSVDSPSRDRDLEGPRALPRPTLRCGGGSLLKQTTMAVTLSVACCARQVSTCTRWQARRRPHPAHALAGHSHVFSWRPAWARGRGFW